MIARFLYYGFVVPFSLLPFWVLYFISDLLYFVLFKVFAYRSKVVSNNLKIAFPDKSNQERKAIMADFYRHICDIIVEGIKGFTISDKELDKRYAFTNPEILDFLYQSKQDVIITAGHYANWEWAAIQSSRVFRHTCVGIYTPLSNKFFEQKMANSRSRTGLVLVPKDQVKAYFNKKHNTPQLYYFLIDQSPSNPERAFWSTFLGVETPIQYGAEKYSKEHNIPVYFLYVDRIKRGYYACSLVSVISNPEASEYGETLRRIYIHLQEEILRRPAWWLWSHRRWKHQKYKKESNF